MKATNNLTRKLLSFALAFVLVLGAVSAGMTVHAAEGKTFYFNNSGSGWAKVNAYAWGDGGTYLGTWPGTAMTKVAGSDTLYSVSVPAGATMIIFNDGSNQTADLTIPTDGKNCFTCNSGSGTSINGTWSVYDDGTIDPSDPSDPTISTNPDTGEVYKVTFNGTNVSFSGASQAASGVEYTATLTADKDYVLPSDIEIIIASAYISGYAYDSATGKLTIPGNLVTGDMMITAKAVPATNAVAMIGTVEYNTLQAAIDAAEAAGSKVTVKLMKSVTTAVTVDAGNFILDLNGNSITASSAVTVNGGELTVTDSGNGGLIDGGSSWMNHAIVISAGTLNIQAGSVTTTGFMGCGVNQTGGTVNVSGGTVHGSYGMRISNGELNVSGGKIYSGDAAVYTEGGNVNISGGTLCGKMGNGNAIYMSSGTGTVTITGGTLGGNSNDYNIYASGGKLLIQGGTFDMVASPGGIRCDVSDAEIRISGGTFTNGIWYSAGYSAPYQELSALLDTCCNFYDADGNIVELDSGAKRITAYTTVGRENTGAVISPEIILSYPTLSFEGEVFYNVYFTTKGMDVAVEDMGLLTWYTRPADSYVATIDTAEFVIPGATANGAAGEYMVRSQGIPAKNLGDNLYLRIYAKLSNGAYVYSPLTYYNAKLYASSIFEKSTNANMKSLVVAMLNYGAAAQVHFNHNVDSLMNADLTAEQKALVVDYSDDMISSLVIPDSAKTVNFKSNGGFSGGYPSVSFEGAFAINYYLAPKNQAEGDITLYCWDLATYNAASQLTEENATAKVTMAPALTDGEYFANFTGIAAKQIDETVFAAGVYTSNGVRYSSPVLYYSLGAYCQQQIATGSETMKDFAKATVVYGHYAELYFA